MIGQCCGFRKPAWCAKLLRLKLFSGAIVFVAVAHAATAEFSLKQRAILCAVGRVGSGAGMAARFNNMRATRVRQPATGSSRRGSVVLETLLVLPILLIGVLAIVQFSTLTSRMSWVKRSSRDAADVATSITLPLAGPVPAEVEAAVSAALDEKGIAWTEIRLEHNLGPSPPYVLVSGSGGDCTAPADVPNTSYVALTVCVEESQLAPNLLETFCFDLDGRFIQQTTIRCY